MGNSTDLAYERDKFILLGKEEFERVCKNENFTNIKIVI